MCNEIFLFSALNFRLVLDIDLEEQNSIVQENGKNIHFSGI